jgi:hypothetical protein
MVEILENSKKLVLKISYSTSSASDFSERITEEHNIEMKELKRERDFNVIERTIEITPKSNDAYFKITITEDNPTNLSAHDDYTIFTFDGKKWNKKYISNPKYH